MVDALHRAARVLRPGGLILDLHPTPNPAYLTIGDPTSPGEPIGVLEAHAAWERHARADAAVQAVVASGAFAVEAAHEFTFRRYADSVDEMCAYTVERSAENRFSPETIARARAAHAARPGASLWLEEQVRMTRLRPVGQGLQARRS